MAIGSNPLWNLNELLNNWIFFIIFVGFLAGAGIYQHVQCVKMNNGKRFKDDKEINGLYIGTIVCAAIVALLILSGMYQIYLGDSIMVT
jgi:hypothetical protein